MEAAKQPHINDAGLRPVVAGTDIKVSLIASEYEEHGMTPDEIVEAHPHLTLAQVHGALAYFYDHQERIRTEWVEARQLIAQLESEYPMKPRRPPQGRVDTT
jgi:uncharacterized protein (DUF433 family)